MRPPSIEFMMIAARGIALILALIALAWVIVRWRRDTTRDAQRVFEQLDLMRTELLQLHDQVGTHPAPASAAAAYTNHRVPVHKPNSPSRLATAKQPTYPNFDAERQATTTTRRNTADIIKPKNLGHVAPRGYEVATRLARSGSSAEELMNTCSLSRHEAELLVRLHAGMKSMQPPNAASPKNEKVGNVSNSSSRANSNLNQLKNIGDRNKTATKPAASLTNRPVTSLPPAARPRVSLVG